MSSIGSRMSSFAASIRASGRAGKRNEPIAALFWVTIAMAAFAGLGATGKTAINSGLHPLQVIAIRNCSCLALLLPLLLWRGASLAWSGQMPIYAVRVSLALFSMWCWFSALGMIPFAELTSIGFLAPLFATVFAVFWLGETVRLRRWTALAVGFIGALIILRPGGSSFGMGQILAIIAAMTSGIIGPLLKQMTAADDPDKIVFISNMLMAPVSVVPALFVWQTPEPWLWPCFVAMGVWAVVGHIALMRGLASADASLCASFEFSRLPFAAAAGWMFFGEVTDVWTWTGALIIVGSATYITRREAALARSGALARSRDGSVAADAAQADAGTGSTRRPAQAATAS